MKVTQLESSKKWEHKGNEKEFQFNNELIVTVVYEIKLLLEQEFRSSGKEVLESLEELVEKGEEQLKFIIKILKPANKEGW